MTINLTRLLLYCVPVAVASPSPTAVLPLLSISIDLHHDNLPNTHYIVPRTFLPQLQIKHVERNIASRTTPPAGGANKISKLEERTLIESYLYFILGLFHWIYCIHCIGLLFYHWLPQVSYETLRRRRPFAELVEPCCIPPKCGSRLQRQEFRAPTFRPYVPQVCWRTFYPIFYFYFLGC
jgi:hypothetical protein